MAVKVLRVGLLSPVRTLDARESRETVSTSAASQIYESPCRAKSGEGTAEPQLLEAVKAESPTTWSAAVKPGIVFSNGTPLTAALAASTLAKSDLLREQAAVEARGERVVFQLKAPNPRFDLTLTVHQCAITLETPGGLLGTGPYLPAPGSSLEALRLVKNPRFRGQAAIDEVVFKVYPPNKDGRPEALLDAIGRGEVDFTSMLSRTDAGSVGGMRKLFQPANSTAILFFNTERPELSNPLARKALALAINRLALAEISYTNALAFAASGLLPPMMGAFRDELRHDVAQAKALLESLPAPKPARLRLATVWAPRPYLPNPQPMAEAIARQLAVLGLDVKVVEPASSDEFYRICLRGDYDLLLGGWIADTPDPAGFLDALLRSDRVQTQAKSALPCANRGRFRSPEMDAALKGFREEGSATHRSRVLELLVQQLPLLPLMYGPSVVLSSWKLKNLEVSPLGIPQFADADLDP